MKQQILTFCGLSIIFVTAVMPSQAQQPVMGEKETLVLKFRKLTGADNVNLGINVSFEDTKGELIATVEGDKELTDAQKQELKKSATDAYDRLDSQLKSFLNEKPKITKLAEGAV